MLVLVTLFLVGPILPERAAWAWTKCYRCWNTTGVSQTSVQAVTNGLESIVYDAVSPSSWGPGAIGYTVSGGVFCTTLTYGGYPRDTYVTVAWNTGDASCRLRDLRWGDGQAIVPTALGGLPGGGMVFYDWPDPGCLTVVITNDVVVPEGVDPDDLAIDLGDVEFVIAQEALDPWVLDDLLDVGFVELRVASINDDIAVLRAEVMEQGSLGTLPSPSANSLIRKLDRAAAYKEAGLTEYLADDLGRASFLWGKAAGHVQNFISEVTNISEKGNLAAYFYDRWIIGVPGGPTTAPQIRDALLALPEGQVLQSLEPLPCGEAPAHPGLDSLDCVEWPVDVLYPGEYTAFVVCSLNLGSGFIMGGSVVGAGGNLLLEWIEQAVAEPTVAFTGPPEILDASVNPEYLWPPDHSIINMTLDVTIDTKVDPNGPPPEPNVTYATWYVADVTSNQPETGTGDGDTSPDWWVDPDDLQSLWLRAERSGNHPMEARLYTITLMAINLDGDVSEEPYELVVPVDHDQG